MRSANGIIGSRMASPNILRVDRAAREIVQTVSSDPRAFFFLVGAGVSCPQVPLSGGIVEECKRRAGSTAPPGLPPIERYSWCLHEAFPSNLPRQRYIRELIKGKNISQANLRLAHLLLSRKVTNLVVTPNFDDFLARALTLFGEQPIVCDHPETIIKIDDASGTDLQVVHIHGTYEFYDCKNLSSQIEEAAVRPQESPYSMRAFLDDLLLRRSPLVAGYSGWEQDVFMAALRSRLRRRLKYNLYWFCYRQADLDALPPWLREHEDVHFVLRPEPAPSTAGESGSIPAMAGGAVKPESGTLPVREVFDTLLQEFHIPEPPLVRDPFEFYQEYFNRVAPRDENEHVDVYFRDLIQNFQQARDARAAAPAPAKDPLEELRAALRAAKYRDAVRYARGLNLEQLNESQRRDVMTYMQDAAQGLPDDSEDEINAYRVIEAAAQTFWRRGGFAGATVVGQGASLQGFDAQQPW